MNQRVFEKAMGLDWEAEFERSMAGSEAPWGNEAAVPGPFQLVTGCFRPLLNGIVSWCWTHFCLYQIQFAQDKQGCFLHTLRRRHPLAVHKDSQLEHLHFASKQNQGVQNLQVSRALLQNFCVEHQPL